MKFAAAASRDKCEIILAAPFDQRSRRFVIARCGDELREYSGYGIRFIGEVDFNRVTEFGFNCGRLQFRGIYHAEIMTNASVSRL